MEGKQRNELPPLLLVHGFGASSRHWKKLIPALEKEYRVYAIDLLGFGLSEKDVAAFRSEDGNRIGLFKVWSDQIDDFIQSVVGEPCLLVANSVGCLAALEVACRFTSQVVGVFCMNPSMRALDVRKRSILQNIFAPLAMEALKVKPLGEFFFSQLQAPDILRQVLLSAYCDPSAVTDSLIEDFARPARDQGALDVFLEFITYDRGPIPEDYFEILPVPSMILWGEQDRLEPLRAGLHLEHFPSVHKFVVLPNVGHCPQDEAPHLVYPYLQEFIASVVRQPQVGRQQ